MSVPRRLRVPENLFKVRIRDEDRRRTIIKEEAKERIVAFELTEIYLAESEEGASVLMDPRIANINPGGIVTDSKERFAAAQLVDFAKSAAAAYVLCRKSISAASGSTALRIAA